ncbi:MAG: UDP-N-acetylmuramate--L-alanine ligase [Clostridia bacterium]|nr:UDP-N-acetylmuramate--L-alanine ligase [Clostridia bacterium]
MENIKHIHFLGIGGVSQSALAVILKSKGYKVSGSDKTESKTTKLLKQKNIDICINGLSNQLNNADLVVYSVAVPNDDKEMVYAKTLGKKVISRAEMLGLLAKEYKNIISIAGSHGKTTTTGMIARVFIEAGLNPTVHIGGELTDYQTNAIVGGEEYFITEACEYYDSFLQLESDVSVILNIQSDHLDYFKTVKRLNNSFLKFANNTKKGGLVVFYGDDKVCKKNYKSISVSYSCENNGVLQARNIREYIRGKYSFDCFFLGKKLANIKLGVYGKHNINNALASIIVGLKYGIDIKIMKKALFEYKGVKRRFEDYGRVFGVSIVHDYAHHPTEIKATISLAKRVSKGDVYVVFQPHTYSRTLSLLDEFKTCFKGAKEVLVYKVYPAREDRSQGIDEKELAKELGSVGEQANSFDNYGEMKRYLIEKTKKNDMILVLGAGDIESFCDYFKN